MDALMKASHKMAEEMYKHAGPQGQAGPQPQGGPQGQGGVGPGPTGPADGSADGPTGPKKDGKGDGPVDADFTVVDDK
jgi:hypothetical protein